MLPDSFIPIAEQSGFIVEIGEWVLREACLNCGDGTRADDRVGMAVNLSVSSCSRTNIVDLVDRVPRRQGSSCQRSARLPETAALRNPKRTSATLAQLKARGVSVSIDDSAGYSSLYLRDFPVDRL